MDFGTYGEKNSIFTNTHSLGFLGFFVHSFRRVTKGFRRCHQKSSEDHELQVVCMGSERENPFTMAHGFYATMGGFAFPGVLDETGEIVEGRLKLTSFGVQFLMKHDPDLLPDLACTSISDRSKANGLGKALLIVQVVWFCLNCASRLVEGLPLSLLELSTLAHGLFTLSSYAMWWFKPMNIDEPTWIPIIGDTKGCADAREALALMTIACPGRVHTPAKVEERVLLRNAVFGGLPVSERTMVNCKHLQPHQIARAALALRAAKRYGITDLGKYYNELGASLRRDVVPRLSDIFWATGLRAGYYGAIQDYIVTACIPVTYGLVHFLGRHSQFPTAVEEKLWCITSLVVMLSGLLDSLLDIIREIVKKYPFRTHKIARGFYSFRDMAYYRVGPFVYVLCSVFLLVESVRQLWYLGPEAFVDASWAYFVPHWL